jgi:hypothetical protein
MPTKTGRLTDQWWKEPTRDQWAAWVAAWLGWTLDAFDFTIFLLIMVPIAKEFGVSVIGSVGAQLTFCTWSVEWGEAMNPLALGA